MIFFQEKMCHNFHFAYINTTLPPNHQLLPPRPLITIYKHLQNIILEKMLMIMKKGVLILVSF